MLGRSTERIVTLARNKKTAGVFLAIFLFAVVVACIPHATFAQSSADPTGLKLASSTGLSTVDIRTYVALIIRAFFGLLGLIAVVLVMYAGLLWMTAQGNPEQIEKAKKLLASAVIGLAIILSAYAIAMFIVNALTGQNGAGGVKSSGRPTQNFVLYSGNRGTALGNGLIDYHYPEPGQTDVPRNTKISITFKKPLALSSVFKNYDDKGTYDTADDEVCPAKPPCTGTKVTPTTALQLNTDNIKLIANDTLGSAGTGSFDEQFNNRYPDPATFAATPPNVKVTAVTMPFSAPQRQTIVIKPVSPIGSPTSNINYRVALRGGENGLKIWDETNDPAKQEVRAAFPTASADGAYYWGFTTNTTIDTTSPKVVAVIPETTPVAGTALDRNQLLQIYFSEAVDATTSSGVLGVGGGFNNVDVQAQCLPGTYPADCSFNGGNPGTVDGTLTLGNRYRTAEFMPSTACEGITETSCGEPVYCLPKNVKLTVITKAATLDFVKKVPEPPAAAIDNGVEDMVGNSLDGNGDGAAQGPQSPAQPGGRPNAYNRNTPQSVLDDVSDTVVWTYNVGSNIDLTVPVLTAIDPTAPPPESALYPAGPSNVPVTTPVTLTWSKIMSIGSMRTGSFDEQKGEYVDPYSTLVFRSRECQKLDTKPCAPGKQCPCKVLQAPGFYLGGLPTDAPPDSMLVPNAMGTGKVTRVALLHPVSPFFNANDLGYTEEDIVAAPGNIPTYLPIARAKIKDVKQNCFWPSQYRSSGGDCVLGPGENSCCNRSGVADSKFLGLCAPIP